jgi:arylsulfatase A-like enzyme
MSQPGSSPGQQPAYTPPTGVGQDLPPVAEGVPGEMPALTPGQELPPLADGEPGHDLPPAEAGESEQETRLRRQLAAAIAVRRHRHRTQPNILIIEGDDIGYWNIRRYNQGIMGYATPNIDSIGEQGITFVDAYADQSCTAGRVSLITGQSPVRTGLTKVGLPGDDLGMGDDPTLAMLLKELGYTCGQFGKNHLGDQDPHLPTVHGFDVFYGPLYHLNASEEPEDPDFPKDPRYPRPRGVLRCEALGRGRQSVEDTGPLSVARMPTVDDEFLTEATRWIREQERKKVPWFAWVNSTRMHVWTRLKEESRGVTGLGLYPDGMVEHDKWVGRLLGLLEQLGVAEDTIVIYSTDNGAEVFTWPDGGCTPFRGEKVTTREGGYRVPMLARWPGRFPAGVWSNDIISMLDWLPTLLAAAGNDHVAADLAKGTRVGGERYQVHLDGYNLLPWLTGDRRAGEWPRHEFLYFTDTGELAALRWDQWKLLFTEQLGHGLGVWTDAFTPLRMPLIINLRSDPTERADEEAIGYGEWFARHMFLMYGPKEAVARFGASFETFPQRFRKRGLKSQLAANFRGGPDQIAQVEAVLGSGSSD